MTHIVESTYKADEHEQAGGGRYVTERHVDNHGRPLTFGPYLLREGMDPVAIMAARAARLNDEFAARDAEAAEAAKGSTPWSKLEFRSALGPVAEQGLDELIATFEGNPAFDAATKRAMRTGFARYREALYIERPLRPEVLSMLGLLMALGIISQAQIDAVVAAAAQP